MSKEETKTKRVVLRNLIVKHSGPTKEWFTPKEVEQFKTAGLVVLSLLAVSGIGLLTIAAPNALQALDKFILPKKSRRRGKSLTPREKEIKTLKIFYYLKSSGLIDLKPAENDFEAKITQKGEVLLAKAKLGILHVPTKKWDGKWWQVAADIPTLTHRTAADMFRKKIKQMGFYALQRTLWFYPFDPRKEIQLIAENFGVQNYITVMEISRIDIEDEQSLKQYFSKFRLV